MPLRIRAVVRIRRNIPYAQRKEDYVVVTVEFDTDLEPLDFEPGELDALIFSVAEAEFSEEHPEGGKAFSIKSYSLGEGPGLGDDDNVYDEERSAE